MGLVLYLAFSCSEHPQSEGYDRLHPSLKDAMSKYNLDRKSTILTTVSTAPFATQRVALNGALRAGEVVSIVKAYC